MRPILDSFPWATRLHVVPEDSLLRYPFEALMPNPDSFLIEKEVDIVYYTSGRGFTDYRGWEPRDLYAYAPISYGVAPDSQIASDFRKQAAGSRFMGGASPGSVLDSLEDFFSWLADSVRSITESWKGQTNLRTRKYACEEAFKADMAGKPKPSVILLATHGAYDWGDDPYTSSFVAFYGANALQRGRSENMEDGLLTALEVMTMDLNGVGLVFLAACQTGTGRVKGGEGIFGLRRAFHTAGVSELVSTLWSVPVDETMNMTSSFFSEITSGKSAGQALKESKLRLLRQDGKLVHPLYWAAPVLSR